MDTKPITLQEMITHALPAGTRVVAQPELLERPVTWVVSISSNELPHLAPGDLLILHSSIATNLANHFPQLRRAGVVGLVGVGEPSTAVIASAQNSQIPLIVLPATTDLRQIERSALTLVIDHDAGLAQRSAQLYQQLTVLSAENAGLNAMAESIGQAAGKTVLIQDKRLSLLAAWFTPSDDVLREAITNWVTASANLPEEMRDRKLAAQSHSILEQSIETSERARLIAPIVSKGMARGFLSLIAPPQAIGPWDRLAAERSAAACALEMAKAKAVSEAEKRVRGGFVDALLAGSLSPLEAMRWAKRDRYNPDGAHVVAVVDWAKKEHPSYRRLETVIHGVTKNWHGGVLTQARENEIILFIRLEPRQGFETARHIAESIRGQANAEFPNDPLALGIGRPVDVLNGLRDSYREARQALSMARRLAEPNPLYFGELNVYRLLFLLEHSPELESFCQEQLGPLIEYDRTQGTDLVETLSAYFAHKSNLSATAEALFVHRNTLLYRMERIRAISGLDLDNPETRLSMQLALRANRLLTAREDV